MNMADRFEATFGSRITRNAAAWDIPHRWAIALFVAPFVPLLAATILAATEHPLFYALTDEDGLVEWLQIVALLAACGAYLTFAYRLWGLGGRMTAFLPVLVAMAVLAVAGEEISWGQRLFGWSTPAALDAINYQGETNIHNILAFYSLVKLAQFGAGGYGTLVPVLALLPRVSLRLLDSYLVPPVALASLFLLPFAYWAARIPLEPGRAMFRFSEITELSLYVGFALFGFLSARRLGAQRARRVGGAAAERPTR